MTAAKNAARFPRVWFGRLASLATMRRALVSFAITGIAALVLPAVALAHDQPETKQSRWVMADWMMDTFFIFSGLAVVAFVAAWKAGHFQELDRVGGIAGRCCAPARARSRLRARQVTVFRE